jgi:hypothetical protein
MFALLDSPERPFEVQAVGEGDVDAVDFGVFEKI